jgi:hypothetical protein
VTAIELGSGPDIEKSLREGLATSKAPHLHRRWRSFARCGVDQKRSEFRVVIIEHLFSADRTCGPRP